MNNIHFIRLIVVSIIFFLTQIQTLNAQSKNPEDEIKELKEILIQIERKKQKEIEDLKTMMEELDKKRQKEIEELKKQIQDLESGYKQTEDTQDKKIDELTRTKEAISSLADRFKNFNIYGDFRLRAELDTNRENVDDPRFRERIRFRIGMNYKLLDNQLAIGARLVTGDSDDPRSPYVNLENNFESFEISLDRAYVQYTPSFYKWISLYGGKFNNTFKTKSIYNELVWDQDVQPEGFAFTYQRQYEGLLDNAFLTVGQYILDREEDEIAWLTTTQIYIAKTISRNIKFDLGTGMYIYYNLDADPALVEPPRNRGNAVVLGQDGEPIEFLSDFRIWNSFVDIEYSGFFQPIILSSQYFHNFGSEVSEDDGFSIGAQLGKASKPRDWKLYYEFQIVEQDSVFTPFSQDDFLLATNFIGHVFGFTYRISNKVSVNLWTLIAKRDKTFETLTDENRVRTRLDLNIKF